jgi:MoaA/NifB/PqqE/SkfB family radical SAM enzyme
MIKPAFCCFGIVDECFLRCKMCHKWKPDSSIAGVKRPNHEQWKDAISSLRTIVDPGFLINFGGGEALLLDGLLDLVRHAFDLGFRTNIASNGCLIDEKMAKDIAASGLSSINLSLDSMTPKTHDYLRGVEGVFDKVMLAIEHLDKYCPKDFEIIICSAIYNINMKDAADVAEWVNRHPRIKWVYYMAAMQPNNTDFNRDWYKEDFNYLWPQDKSAITSVIEKLIELKKAGYKINNQECQLEAFKKYFNHPDRFVKNTSCNLDQAVHVASVGDIYICYDWALLGNIMRDDIAQVWYSPLAEKARQDIRNCKKNCHHLINCFFEGDYPFIVKDGQ